MTNEEIIEKIRTTLAEEFEMISSLVINLYIGLN